MFIRRVRLTFFNEKLSLRGFRSRGDNWFWIWNLLGNGNDINEPADEKTYNKTCAPSEVSDQPAQQCSLIRVSADCMCILRPLGYLKRDKLELLPHWIDVQADLSLRWSHRSYWLCRALAEFYLQLVPTSTNHFPKTSCRVNNIYLFQPLNSCVRININTDFLRRLIRVYTGCHSSRNS